MELVSKAKVVLSAVVTWLVFISLVLMILAEEIARVWPGSTGEEVVEWIIRVGVWVGAAIAIIRRVTPVIPEERGILPK